VTVLPAATPDPQITLVDGLIYAIIEGAAAHRPGGGSELIGVPLRRGVQAAANWRLRTSG
jgi:hypothetical protein